MKAYIASSNFQAQIDIARGHCFCREVLLQNVVRYVATCGPFPQPRDNNTLAARHKLATIYECTRDA
jgi:hypothetical protein